MFSGEYIPPILTVDSVVFQIINGSLSVLLIRRANEPFKGMYALPGGYNAAGETTHDAMERVLKTKGGVELNQLRLIEQLYTFDTVARDPRGHAVSVTYMGLGKDIEPNQAGSTQSSAFYALDNMPKLAYDHAKIIQYALDRLRSKVSYTNAIYALLERQFTLTQVQKAYEAVLGSPLDKRNFRKKFLSLDLVHETGEYLQEGAHRPAMLYEFNQPTLESLSRSFD